MEKQHKSKGMSYSIPETLHTTIDTGESYITQITPSAKGRSFFGEALELLDRESSLTVSSIQRHLKVDFETAKSILDGLIEAKLVKKSAENFTYIRS